MAIRAATSLTGSAIASGARGGRGSLAGKTVIFGRIGPEGSTSFIQIPQVREVSDPRGKNFSAFLRLMRAGDGPNPNVQPVEQPLSDIHLNAFRQNSPALIQNSSTEPVLGSVKRGSNIVPFPEINSFQAQHKHNETVKNPRIENRETSNNVIPFERGRARIRSEVRLLVERTRTSNLNAIEQQLLLSRVMRSFARTRGLLRNQAIPMVSSEPVVEIQLRSETRSAAEIATNNSSLTQVKSELVQEEKNEVPVKLRTEEDIFARRRRRAVSIDQEKAVVDHNMNEKRKRVVIAERDRFRLLGRDDARKEILVGAGLISREFRSTILDVVDDDARDGGVVRAISDLSARTGRMTDEEIKHSLENHTAVKRAKDGEEVSKLKLYEVIVDPEEPRRIVSEELVLPKTRQTRVVNLETVRLREEGRHVLEAVKDEEVVPEELGLIQMSGAGNLDFVQPVVDRMVYIGSLFQPRFNDIEERKQLLVA